MKQIFYIFFAICLFGLTSVCAQSTKRQQKQDHAAAVYPPRISSPSTRDPKAEPTAGSIWVNRDEIINGRPVTTFTPEELVTEILLGQGDKCGMEGLISNVTFAGSGWNGNTWTENPEYRNLSYFSHGTIDHDTTINGYQIRWSLDMERGLLLTTGDCRQVEGPNDSGGGVISSVSTVSLFGDPELTPLVTGSTITNGAKLEFDFVPVQNEISFDYIFASTEYPEFVDSYNDVFGFFISQVDDNGNIIPGTTRNIALLPNSQTAITIDNVNWGNSQNNTGPTFFPGCPENCGNNAQYYVPIYNPAYSSTPYQGVYTEFDGRTTVLKAKAEVTPGRKYHLKLAVANVGDENYGTGVFLRAGSLDLGIGFKNLGEGGLEMSNIFEGCETTALEISFPSSLTETTHVALQYSGSAVNDICQLDNSPMPASQSAPPLASSVTIPYKVKSPVTSGGEIQIISTTSRGNCEQVDTIYLTVYSAVSEPEIATTLACRAGEGSITATVTGGSPNVRMSIDNGMHWQHAGETFSGLSPGNYLLMTTDSVSCDTIHSWVTIYGEPVLSNETFIIPSVCSGETAKYTATCDFEGVSMSWTRASVPGISPTTGSGTGTVINESLTNSTTSPIPVTYVYTLTVDNCSNTEEVTVMVYPELLQPDPSGTTIPYLTTHTFNLGGVTGNFGAITYLWQESVDGLLWSAATGVNDLRDYTTPDLTCNMYYRRQATADVCSETITSDAAKIALTCSITLFSNPTEGGGTAGEGTFDYGDPVIVTAEPAECYDFTNWTDANGTVVSTANPFTFTIDKDTALTANFVKRTYNITLSANPSTGNKVSGGGPNIPCGTGITAIAEPDDCYDFINWTEGGVEVSTDTEYIIHSVTQSRILVANFLLKTYNVNLSLVSNPPDGGSTSGGEENIPCETPKTIIAEPDDCFDFVSWTDSESGEVVSTDASYTFIVTGHRTFVANFVRKTYNIAVSTPPFTGGSVSGGGINIPCNSLMTLTAVPEDCYEFINWTEEDTVASTEAIYSFLVTQHRNLVATFALKYYDVTLSENPPMSGTTSGGDTNLSCGSYKIVTAVSNECYNFINWTENGVEVSQNPVYGFFVTDDRNLVANFSVKIFNVNISAAPSAGGDLFGGGMYPCGAIATVIAQPDPCYNFINWTENGDTVSTNPVYEFILTGYRNLVAHFEIITYPVVLLADPSGYGTTAGSDSAVNCGSTIPITAIPSLYYHFTHWSEYGIPLPLNVTDQITVTEPRTLTAHFEPNTYVITVSAAPPGSGTATGGGTIAYGDFTTVVAIPEPQWVFSYWTENGSIIHDAPATYTFQVTGTRDLVANFEPETYTILVKKDPIGGGDVDTSGYNISLGTIWKISAKPYTNYDFVKWTKEDGTRFSFDADTAFIVEESLVLIAHFSLKTHKITVLPNPATGGTVTGGGYYVSGSEAMVTATPDTTYRFVNWTDADTDSVLSKESTFKFPVTQSRNLLANFVSETYNIILLTNPDKSGSVEGGGYNIPFGDSITVKAIPNQEWEFVNWTEDTITVCEYPDYPFNVVQSRILTANFKHKTFDVIVSSNPPAGGKVWENKFNILYGTMDTVRAEANPNYVFVNWTENDTAVYEYENYPFPVTRDRELVANFEWLTFDITVLAEPPYGGEVWGDGTAIPYGTDTAVYASANQHFTFRYWTYEDGIQPIGIDTRFPFTVVESRTCIAHFTADSYPITLSANPSEGGTATTEGNYDYGMTITVTAISDDCYIFENWTEDDTVVHTEPDFTFTVDGPRELVANFVQKTVNLSTSENPTNGGTTLGSDRNIPCGEERTVTATPETGYMFLNWTKDGVEVSTDSVYTFPVKESCNLTANFMYVTYNISLSKNLYEGGTVWGGGNWPLGSEITVHAQANIEYQFVNWTENNREVSTDTAYTFNVFTSRHLTANFEWKSLTITTSSSSVEGGTTSGDDTHIPYGEIRTVTAEASPNFDFKYWMEDSVPIYPPESNYTFPVTRSRDLTALFELKTFDIVISINPSEGGWAEGGDSNIPFGTPYTVKAFANPDYHFVNWTEDSVVSVDAIYPFTVTKTRYLVANFQAITSTITLLANPPEGGTLLGGGEIIQGKETTVTATANNCYDFVNWTENGVELTTDTSYAFTVEEARTLVANFILQTINITTATNPPEGGIIEGDFTDIPCGTTVTVTATANPEYYFTGWTEDEETVSTNAAYTFAVTETTHLVAHFTINTYDIVLSASPQHLGAVAGDGNFPYGKEITVSAMSLSGYSFVNWTEEGIIVSTDADYTFTVTQSRNLVAHFEITTYIINVESNNVAYGYVTGGGVYYLNDVVKAKAFTNKGYRFANWTIGDSIVSDVNTFEFIVTENVDLVANFYALDFDAYTFTLWDNTFMLDLQKLEDEEYEIIDCTWFKNGKEELNTRTINQYSYSAGSNATDFLELAPTWYMFRIATKNGIFLFSTEKTLTDYEFYHAPPSNAHLLIYPNPAIAGNSFTVEGVIEGTSIYVYNQVGVCVGNTIAGGNTVTLTLNLPAGIYLVRNNNKEGKVTIMK